MSVNSYTGGTGKRPVRIPGRNLLVSSLVSTAVYLLLASLIFYFFHDTGLSSAFTHGLPAGGQLAAGAAAGILSAAIIGVLMIRPPVSEVMRDFHIVEVVSKSRLTAFDRIQLSLFAGAGEELLFRGAIQPLLGVWLTSLIFVGLHRYFKFKSPGHLLFGALILGLSAGLGYLYEYAGLIAAMTAHSVYDIIILYLVQHMGNRQAADRRG